MLRTITLITTLMLFGLMPYGCNTPAIQSCNKSAVIEVLATQQAAWNEGDLEKFCAYYWQSDSVKIVGMNGIIYGYEKILDLYRSSLMTAEKRGTLKFTTWNHECVGAQFQIITGKFELFREADTLSGHFTLHFKEIEGMWKIVYDHTS